MAASSATYPTPSPGTTGAKSAPQGFRRRKRWAAGLGHVEPDRTVGSVRPIGLVPYQEAPLRPKNRGFAEVCLKIFEAKSKA